jgi:hypothetical protein
VLRSEEMTMPNTTTTKLTAVDQTLAFSDATMPQPLVDAWSYTTTFAQAYARTVNGDPSTRSYFDAMTGEFQKLAWNVTEATKLDYTMSAGMIEPATLVSSIIDPYLTADQQKQLGGVLNAIKTPDSGIKDFLTFFWNKASTHAKQSSMAFGPLTQVSNSSNISVVYYTFNFDAESWRSLFVARSTAELSVTAYHLAMNLNLSLYDAMKDGLISRLGGKQKDHIRETALDL